MPNVEIDFSIQFIDLDDALNKTALSLQDSLVEMKKDSRKGKRSKPQKRRKRKSRVRKKEKEEEYLDDRPYIPNFKK